MYGCRFGLAPLRWHPFLRLHGLLPVLSLADSTTRQRSTERGQSATPVFIYPAYTYWRMNRNLYTLLIAFVVLVLAVTAFTRFGSEQAQAPTSDGTGTSTGVLDEELGADSGDAGAIAPEGVGSVNPDDGDDAGTSGYTLAQVTTHASAESCWVAMSGGVYDVTAWIDRHPGGRAAILGICGTDATEQFTRQHGSNAKAQAALAQFRIGILAQ